MLSQFISDSNAAMLGDIDFNFPEGTHAVGRLDKHSEGLLILTTNKRVTKLLFQGPAVHKRTYLAKVRNTVSEERLQQMRTGIKILTRGGQPYITSACAVTVVQPPADLFPSLNPVPDYPPFTWLQVTLTEGKYHQVRKMTAAVYHKCTRLIRTGIEDLLLNDLAPGAVREMEETDFFRLLKIDNWQWRDDCR